MKKFNFILIIVLISAFYSCSKDDDNTQIKTSTENGFTFNSEFFATNELLLAGDPGHLYFFINDDTSKFNKVTGTFDGNPGQLILITIPFELEDQVNFERTYTNAVQDNEDVLTGVSFNAALLKDVLSIKGNLNLSEDSIESILPAITGEVTVSFDSETSVFSLNYTFTTTNGAITGFHESEFITIE